MAQDRRAWRTDRHAVAHGWERQERGEVPRSSCDAVPCLDRSRLDLSASTSGNLSSPLMRLWPYSTARLECLTCLAALHRALRRTRPRRARLRHRRLPINQPSISCAFHAAGRSFHQRICFISATRGCWPVRACPTVPTQIDLFRSSRALPSAPPQNIWPRPAASHALVVIWRDPTRLEREVGPSSSMPNDPVFRSSTPNGPMFDSPAKMSH